MKADGRDERVFLGCLSGLEIYPMFWGRGVGCFRVKGKGWGTDMSTNIALYTPLYYFSVVT
jgi:hypothetical protein